MNDDDRRVKRFAAGLLVVCTILLVMILAFFP